MLWFAFKLVSLNHWIQQRKNFNHWQTVVICFQISIFEPLNTACSVNQPSQTKLWFAFKLVSLNHWIQLNTIVIVLRLVVICFQISIFEPLNTANQMNNEFNAVLWFAFKLVSLNHWIQLLIWYQDNPKSCDLLSN